MRNPPTKRTGYFKAVALFLCMVSTLPAFAQTSFLEALGSAVGKAFAESAKGRGNTPTQNSPQANPTARTTEARPSSAPANMPGTTKATTADTAVNPFLSLLYTACSADELGKVTKVDVLNAKQANEIYRKGNAFPAAKPDEVYLQIFAKSKVLPKDYSLTKVQRAPSPSEKAELIGKPQCTYTGE